MTRRGYIVFEYNKSTVWSSEYASSKKELMRIFFNWRDDKWDVTGRHKIHYFYLDLSTMKFFPLERWKKDYDPKLQYDQSDETTLSKTFN